MNNSNNIKNKEEKNKTSYLLPTLSVELGSFKSLLKDVIGNESIRAFAEKCGLSEGVMRNYLRGDTFPTLDRLQAIADTAGKHISYFVAQDNRVVEDKGKYNLKNDEFALVPRYNVQASAGGGADVHSEQVVDHLAFKRSWLHEMGLQQEKLALITAKGDSMEPTIKNGDMLLVDTRVTTAADGIYVLRMDGMLLAKRLIKNPINQDVTIKSDNNIYPPFTAQKDQLGLLEIVGRVVWIGGKI